MPERHFEDSYLLSYSDEHVSYEIDMLFGIARLLVPSTKIGAGSLEDAKRLNNAMVESAGIHLRNLIDFFYLDNPKTTDIVATDFYSNWATIRPPKTASLETARIRANKELAHLTTSRLAGTPPEKGWDFPSLAEEMRPIIRLFLQSARSSALSPKVVLIFQHHGG